MVVYCRNENDLMECLKYMDGSLTGSIHAERDDLTLASKIVSILESLVGRIIWNGFPPGVIPGIATHHGGPWPAVLAAEARIGRCTAKRKLRENYIGAPKQRSKGEPSE